MRGAELLSFQYLGGLKEKKIGTRKVASIRFVCVMCASADVNRVCEAQAHRGVVLVVLQQAVARTSPPTARRRTVLAVLDGSRSLASVGGDASSVVLKLSGIIHTPVQTKSNNEAIF